MLLQLNEIHAYYGNIHAVKGVSFEISPGQIIGLIGSNGAGKSTLLKVISGLMKPASGTVTFNGERIDLHSPADIVQMGVSQVPEGRHIFPKLSVRENLLMGAYSKKDKSQIINSMDRVFEMFPILKERKNQPGGTLSGGEQQMLAIGRGLMSQPKLLILDEPSMGLAPLLVENIALAIKGINEKGMTVLLVEQKAPMAFQLCHFVYVMETGKIALSGTSEELSRDERVKKVYLGQR